MNKNFDCVKMKHRTQRKLREDYERRKGEFQSHANFLTAKSEESEWQRSFWETVRAAKSKAAS